MFKIKDAVSCTEVSLVQDLGGIYLVASKGREEQRLLCLRNNGSIVIYGLDEDISEEMGLILDANNRIVVNTV